MSHFRLKHLLTRLKVTLMMPVWPVVPPPSDHHGDTEDTAPLQDPPIKEEQGGGGWSDEEDLEEFGGLDRKWLLWHDFMTEHAHLETWLHSTEQAITCASPAHITYVGAKEKLRRLERLRCDAGIRLVQSDSLTQRSRTLTRLFGGAMRTRLLALARSCGQRCDDVLVELEAAAARLKHLVREWEGFEEERAELGVWLAELDARLTDTDHLTGSTCQKLQRLQLFQQRVCVNAARLNDFLRRGELLMRRCAAADARVVERELLELLRCRGRVLHDISRTHTRLLSMRLVFEDDHVLSQASDSGCPSESLLEEDEALDPASSPPHPPLTPDDPVLEWDPSVDIGHSVCQDAAAAACFTSSTGVKRRSYLGTQDQEAELRLKGWLGHAHTSVEARWATSTPARREAEPNVDRELIGAWLGVESPAPSCSRMVQTEVLHPEEDSCEEEQRIRSELGVTSSGVPFTSPALLLLLLLLILAAFLLACLCWKSVACRHRAAVPFSPHLMLTYVNGPPPT
eukprot:XP_011615929.1 PREDICTED: nesprin-2-like isoform X1 [Takifugu rubripes]